MINFVYEILHYIVKLNLFFLPIIIFTSLVEWTFFTIKMLDIARSNKKRSYSNVRQIIFSAYDIRLRFAVLNFAETLHLNDECLLKMCLNSMSDRSGKPTLYF